MQRRKSTYLADRHTMSPRDCNRETLISAQNKATVLTPPYSGWRTLSARPTAAAWPANAWGRWQTRADRLARRRAALIAALSARDAGRFAEAASLLRPLAESGHVEAQAHLGSLMMLGLHRFATQ